MRGPSFAALAALVLVVGVGLLASPARTGRAQPRQPDPPSFSDVLDIFEEHCTRCHAGERAPRGQDLSRDHAWDSIVDQPSEEVPELMRVRPGEPEQSYLFLKITDRHLEIGGRGRRMPLGQPALPPRAVRTIERWIAAGAPR